MENIWRAHFFFVFQFLENKGERQQSWRDEWSFSETIDSNNHSKIEPDGMLAQFSGPKADSAEVGRLVRFFLFKALIWGKFRQKLSKNCENEHRRFTFITSWQKSRLTGFKKSFWWKILRELTHTNFLPLFVIEEV